MNLTAEDKSFLVYTLAGVFVGLISVSLENMQALTFSLVLLYTLGKLSPRLFSLEGEKKEFKWLLANGIYPYTIFWIFIWVLAKNI